MGNFGEIFNVEISPSYTCTPMMLSIPSTNLKFNAIPNESHLAKYDVLAKIFRYTIMIIVISNTLISK